MRAFARLAVLSATAVAGLAIASPAFAHVSVQPEGTAAKGGYATVNVKVPNERADASTVKVEVTFPADHPLASVMPQAVPGWNIAVTRTKLAKPLTLHGKSITEAVSKVTWTATDKGIQPGYFQKFPLSLGQLPEDADELVLKALQTYSSKEVVRWIEPSEEGQEEPEHPAPVLRLSAATDDHHGTATATPAPKTPKAPAGEGHGAESAEGHDGDGHGTERWLGIGGMVLGAAGLVTALITSRRRGDA
ncbi:YcnI family protein [Streptomyces showdoensis]|uniref:Membrane protein n=1 Tax=Streptomyces showdoensis TaxID=68268 RepID=A0A2P2GHC9_STREW|nr:YcnI family protein [Streptomyces showdoensis]KKZ70922.1 membrane protein [Streptomyces showdoensis]